MRCNACWRELQGRAISTTCGHLLCTEDASKILSNDGACPICDQVLSKSLMKPVDTNPNEEWMVMAGISPQIRILSLIVLLFYSW
uniref:RING-type domain-containing protein n=1 Tax=Brassica campestris TaxID=3711 RepID=M4FAL2_BRACM